MNVRLYVWQRGTAALLAPMVLVHVAVIFYASRRGFSASEIFSRTRGSVAWGLFYGTFVVAASIHASIGIRTILAEWSPFGNKASGYLSVIFGAFLLALGARAVIAVVIG